MAQGSSAGVELSIMNSSRPLVCRFETKETLHTKII